MSGRESREEIPLLDSKLEEPEVQGRAAALSESQKCFERVLSGIRTPRRSVFNILGLSVYRMETLILPRRETVDRWTDRQAYTPKLAAYSHTSLRANCMVFFLGGLSGCASS